INPGNNRTFYRARMDITMRDHRTLRLLQRLALLSLLSPMLMKTTTRADEARDKAVGEQKKAAEAAWKSLEIGDAAHLETKHLLIYAPKAMDKRLKATGAQLEKYHEQATKALALDLKDAYQGKITVYLFSERGSLPAFVRR